MTIDWVDDPANGASKGFVGPTCQLLVRVFEEADAFVVLVKAPHWAQRDRLPTMDEAKRRAAELLEASLPQVWVRAAPIEAELAGLRKRVEELEAWKRRCSIVRAEPVEQPLRKDQRGGVLHEGQRLPWDMTPWYGAGRHVAADARVDVCLRSGSRAVGRADLHQWSWAPSSSSDDDVIAYRVIR